MDHKWINRELYYPTHLWPHPTNCQTYGNQIWEHKSFWTGKKSFLKRGCQRWRLHPFLFLPISFRLTERSLQQGLLKFRRALWSVQQNFGLQDCNILLWVSDIFKNMIILGILLPSASGKQKAQQIVAQFYTCGPLKWTDQTI